MQLLTLSRVLAKRPNSPASTAGLDPVALILDSLPGSKTFSGAIAIFTQAVRNPVQRLLGFPVVLLGLSLLDWRDLARLLGVQGSMLSVRHSHSSLMLKVVALLPSFQTEASLLSLSYARVSRAVEKGRLALCWLGGG